MGSNKSKNTKEQYEQKDVNYRFNNTTFQGNCSFGSGKNENNEIKPGEILFLIYFLTNDFLLMPLQ